MWKKFKVHFFEKLRSDRGKKILLWFAVFGLSLFPIEYWIMVIKGNDITGLRYFVGVYLLLVPLWYYEYARLIELYCKHVEELIKNCESAHTLIKHTVEVNCALVDENERLHKRLEKGYE